VTLFQVLPIKDLLSKCAGCWWGCAQSDPHNTNNGVESFYAWVATRQLKSCIFHFTIFFKICRITRKG